MGGEGVGLRLRMRVFWYLYMHAWKHDVRIVNIWYWIEFVCVRAYVWFMKQMCACVCGFGWRIWINFHFPTTKYFMYIENMCFSSLPSYMRSCIDICFACVFIYLFYPPRIFFSSIPRKKLLFTLAWNSFFLIHKILIFIFIFHLCLDSGISRWLLVTGIRLHVPGIILMHQNFELLNPKQHQAVVILTMNCTMIFNWWTVIRINRAPIH